MKPSEKSPAMEKAIKDIFGIDRIDSIQANVCVFCKAKIRLDSFRDIPSLKEYRISGMCQKCQDSIFGE